MFLATPLSLQNWSVRQLGLNVKRELIVESKMHLFSCRLSWVKMIIMNKSVNLNAHSVNPLSPKNGNISSYLGAKCHESGISSNFCRLLCSDKLILFWLFPSTFHKKILLCKKWHCTVLLHCAMPWVCDWILTFLLAFLSLWASRACLSLRQCFAIDSIFENAALLASTLSALPSGGSFSYLRKTWRKIIDGANSLRPHHNTFGVW